MRCQHISDSCHRKQKQETFSISVPHTARPGVRSRLKHSLRCISVILRNYHTDVLLNFMNESKFEFYVSFIVSPISLQFMVTGMSIVYLWCVSGLCLLLPPNKNFTQQLLISRENVTWERNNRSSTDLCNKYKRKKVTQLTQKSIQMLSNYIYEVCDINSGELIEGFINYIGYFQ